MISNLVEIIQSDNNLDSFLEVNLYQKEVSQSEKT